MDRATFLKALQKGLQWMLSPEETKEILCDYKGFFANGIADGKCEAAICLELGDPSEIAQELTEGRRWRLGNPLWAKALIRVLLFAAIIAVGFVIGNNILWRFGVFPWSCLLYAVMVMAMWLVLIGFSTRFPSAAKLSKLWERALIACHILLICVVAIDTIMFYRGLYLLAWGLPITATVTFYANTLSHVIYFLPPLLILFSAAAFTRMGSQWFTLTLHALGSAVNLWTQFNIMGALDRPADLVKLPLTLIVYGLAVLITLLFYNWLQRRTRRQG